MRGGAGELKFGINQTLDFIFYSGNKVLVQPNTAVSDNKLCLIGTFAGREHNKETEASLTLAIDRCMKKLESLGITNISLTNLAEIKNGFNPYIEGDKRYNDNGKHDKCTAKTCPVITQIFSMEVEDMSKFKNEKTEWVSYDDDSIFIGHRKILKQIQDHLGLFNEGVPVEDMPEYKNAPYLFEESTFGGGRRTRKRRGKKSKKTKKKGKKTHRRRH